MVHPLVSFVGQYLIVLPALVALGWLLWAARPSQRVTYAGLLVLAGALAMVLAKVGASVVSDPRPFLADGVKAWFPSATDNGFPSDHTLLATVFAATLWPFNRRLSLGLFAVAVLIGSARVIAGVHHGLDVAGALVLGSAAAAIAWQLIARTPLAQREALPTAG